MAQSRLQEIERRSQCDMVILFVATANAHKMQEIRAILGERFHYLTLNNFPGAPKAVEDADTFDGNAVKKAVGLAEWLARRQNGKRGSTVLIA